ncbi:TIGR03943 family protein [Streptomyces sp. NPDC005648]|uniref:TIGR03943 family putative permease subunit n=1 Tax=Streptomyces sp. NPDC005648 TaxID=3157044 RepID=UPI0033B71DA4
MRRPLQITLLVLSGLGLLRIALFSDLYLRYVKEGMRPLLIASGAVLILLGVADAVSYGRRHGAKGHTDHGDEGHTHHHGDGGHGHDHSGGPRAAWLLLVPAVSLLLYAPPALGAYTASREPSRPAVTPRHDFDPLPAASLLPITLTDFALRVRQDRTRAISGRTVQLSGFVTAGKRSDSWFLTRIIISCCAADAQSVKLRIYGPAPRPDTWVAVTGTWHPAGSLGTESAAVALDARTVEEAAKPVNSYTDDLPLVPTR